MSTFDSPGPVLLHTVVVDKPLHFSIKGNTCVQYGNFDKALAGLAAEDGVHFASQSL